MVAWVVVEQNKIVEEYDNVPECWRNVSNFNTLQDDFKTMRSFGWFPVYTIDLGEIDPYTQEYSEWSMSWDEENLRYVRTRKINARAFPIDPNAEKAEQRNSFMRSLRAKRNELISQSDWTQLPDVITLQTEELRNGWLTYRTSLRDLPTYYDEHFPDMTNFADISWPTPPSQTE